MKLTFIGTGGGRFTLIKQLRHTGGMYLEHDDYRLYMDPGTGALVHARRNDIPLQEMDALLVSHAHLDHCGDMHALIEAMTAGGDKETGTLLASPTVLHGADLADKYVSGDGTYGDRIDAPLDTFHRQLVADTVELTQGEPVDCGPWTLHCIENEHSDPHALGWKLVGDEKKDRLYRRYRTV